MHDFLCFVTMKLLPCRSTWSWHQQNPCFPKPSTLIFQLQNKYLLLPLSWKSCICIISSRSIPSGQPCSVHLLDWTPFSPWITYAATLISKSRKPVRSLSQERSLAHLGLSLRHPSYFSNRRPLLTYADPLKDSLSFSTICQLIVPGILSPSKLYIFLSISFVLFNIDNFKEKLVTSKSQNQCYAALKFHFLKPVTYFLI